MSIMTTRGDDGTTDLWSGGRVPKDHPRIEACGEVDELSSLLGLARVAAGLEATRAELEGLQRELVRVAAEIASTDPPFAKPIVARDSESLAARIVELESRIALRGFVLLGRTEASARIDLARASARRLERRAVSLSREAPVSGELLRYLNRLSDLLYMLARSEEAAEGKIEYV